MRNIFFQAALAVLALTGSVSGLPASYPSASYEVFEKVAMIPDGWTRVPSMEVDPEKVLSLRIHLSQQNVQDFERKVLDISTPGHPTYGNHMTTQQIKMMLRPTDNTISKVLNWLAEFNLDQKVVQDHDWIKFNATVKQVEELLHAEYSYFQDEETQRIVLRTLSYSLPADLHNDILLIQPTTMFGMRPMRSHIMKMEEADSSSLALALKTQASSDLDIPTACNSTITPACLKALYNFGEYTSSGNGKLGVNGFLEQYAQWGDLATFLSQFAPDAVGGNFSFESVMGGLNVQNPSDINSVAEANLDIQYTVSLSYPIPNVYYSTAGRPPYIPDLDVVENDSEPYLDWLNWILEQDDIPQVITTSYGENEQTVPLSYRNVTCNLFAQLGARGTSVIFSSGDAGPGWSCRSNDGKNSTKFLPTYPAACPWVTSVGGTVHVEPEEAVYFSSGGFSETWPAPEYQTQALEKYFSEHESSWQPWEEYFVRDGRGFPDVAVQGYNFAVVLKGRTYLIGGTSASSPAFAGIVSLLNDDRLSKGLSPLGFLNPWLYSDSVSQTFTDITKGRSTGCDGTTWGSPIAGNPAIIPDAGWDAVAGWDPVTGLGTPDFEALRATY